MIREPADFAVDVLSPDAKRAEALVFDAFNAMYPGKVLDVRGKHLSHDFIVDGQTYDVKFDRYYESTANVVFEKFHEPVDFRSGDVRRGWGWSRTPDWLLVVGVSFSRVSMFDMELLRQFVITSTRSGVPSNWKSFARINASGYFTHGYAIPVSELASNIGPIELELAP